MFAAATYVARRNALRARMGGGLILVPGHQDSPMNYHDNTYPFRQDSSFLYFFGLNKPGLVGLIDADSGEDWLLGDDGGLEDIVWSGPQPTLAECAASCGVTLTQPRSNAQSRIANAVRSGRTVHFTPPYRCETAFELAAWLDVPLVSLSERCSIELIRAIVALRERKTPEEVGEIESALAVTAHMHHAAMRAVRPHTVEREVVGIMEGIARSHDWHLAYASIFSKRGEVLHNHGHGLTLENGDLVVNDTGCASALGYASDITRTIPVGGRFVGVKRELYDIVLNAQSRAISALRPGVPFIDAHKLACRILVDGLKSLGCFQGDTEEIVESGAYAIAFQCGLGHQMGLDVHDMEALGEEHVGYDGSISRSPLFGLNRLRLAKPLQPGFVVTVEPGIYIIPTLLESWRQQRRHREFINYAAFDPLLQIGIRIEDDVLITADGCRVLGPHIARTATEVEAAMVD